MFDKFGDIAAMMKNLGKMQEAVKEATERLAQLQVEGTAGGGAVTVTASGKFEVLKVRIDPKLLADGDAELLEDLVVAATNAALAKAKEQYGQQLQNSVGPNLPLPDLSTFFGR